jgi:ATP-dependent RNA helicase MRH4
MSALGRISLPPHAPRGLLSPTRVTAGRSVAPLRVSWVTARFMPNLRQRRRAARNVLSTNVGSSSPREDREAKGEFGPFAGMNRTKAPIEGTRPPRSPAARKRSGELEKTPKKESPLYKALKMQTSLAGMPYTRRTATKMKISEINSFDQFPLLPAVRNSILSNALEGMVDVSPTPIQRLAIPRLLEDAPPKTNSNDVGEAKPQYDQVLLAAETGSGKTLAYLIPLVDALKREEALEKEEEARRGEQKAKEREERRQNHTFDLEPEEPPITDAGRPRIIIVVPTAELVEQIGARVKALSHTLKYRSGMISSSYTPRRIKSIVFRADGIDILVSTPYLLTSIAQTEPYILSRVSHLVLDEADSLLDRSFSPITKEVISKTAPTLRRLILCSATIPRSLDDFLRKEYPKTKRLMTPNLHAIPRRVQMGVVDIEKNIYRGNRSLACADVIWSIGKAGDPSEKMGQLERYMEPRVKKIIVFVNEREDAAEVTQFLQSKGIDAVSLSNQSPARQQEILNEFTQRRRVPSPDEVMQIKRKRAEDNAIPLEMEQPKKPERHLEDTKVLVTTDRTSRGVDTMEVKTVILYHVPHNTIDFIHRLGRLGRMGKRGRGIVLVGKKDRKDVIKEVREAMFRGQALI